MASNTTLRKNRNQKTFSFVARLIFVAVIISACSTSPAEKKEVVLDSSYYTNKFDYKDSDSLLGRGINLGNCFEGIKTGEFPLSEGSWSGGHKIIVTDLERIRAKGFKNIRIPARWSDHAETTAPYTIDPDFLARVKEVVDQSLEKGFIVVLNTHHYNEMMSDPADKLAGHRARLSAIWNQLCIAFPITDYPADKLIFELLNEPNGTVGYSDWNTIISDLTTVIWTDNGATQAGRKIMVGTANWGGVPGLYKLDLPAACTKDNTIITVHYYEPFHFTHQGADWSEGADAWIGTTWTGSEAEQKPLIDLMNSIGTWNTEGFEVYMGEFGAYSKYIEPEYQKAWTAFIAREAEKRKISWAYWEYFSGFGAWDPESQVWRPQVINALIPIPVE